MKKKYFLSKLHIEPGYAVIQRQEPRTYERNTECLELMKERQFRCQCRIT